MTMYRAYKLEDVLEMYASAFFLLLEEGYRLKYKNYRMLTTIISLPHMENDEDRDAIIESLDSASADPRDILEIKDDGDSGIDRLREALG